MPETNTARSKKYLEKQGYSVWVVEQNVNIPAKFPGGKPMIFKRDMFNIFDLCCFNESAIIGVQTTTTANQASRIAKIVATPEALGWARVGKIYVHGWKKVKKINRWQVTIWAIEVDSEFGGLKSREITLADSPLFANIQEDEGDESEETF